MTLADDDEYSLVVADDDVELTLTIVTTAKQHMIATDKNCWVIAFSNSQVYRAS